MPDTPHLHSHLAATLLVIAGLGQAARGQDDIVVDDATSLQQQQQGMFQRNMMVNNFQLNADQLVFGNSQNPTAGRVRLNATLALRVDDLARSSRLTEAQKAKLQLAGRGDIKRFFDRVDEKRRQSATLGGDFIAYNKLVQELQPLRSTFQMGPFGEGSLFAKTLAKTLDPSQRDAASEAARDREAYRREAKVEMAVATIDASVGLTEDQRVRVRRLIVEDTRPPKRPGPYYDYYVTLLQLSKLPEARLKAVFNDAQLRLLASQFDLVRQMEPGLIENDMMPDLPAKP